MKVKLGICAIAACVLSGGPVTADHIVSPEAMQLEMTRADQQRDARIGAMNRVLDTPVAAEAARRLGADVEDLKAIVPTLDDAELADLAARAEALDADPVAGMTAKDTVWVILIVIAVLVVLGLLAAAAD